MSTIYFIFGFCQATTGYAAYVFEKQAYEAAEKTGAEIYEIKSTERTEGTLGFWWCGRFGMHRKAMPTEETYPDLSAYEHITICSPIWVFALAAPVRDFCKKAAGKIK